MHAFMLSNLKQVLTLPSISITRKLKPNDTQSNSNFNSQAIFSLKLSLPDEKVELIGPYTISNFIVSEHNKVSTHKLHQAGSDLTHDNWTFILSG